VDLIFFASFLQVENEEIRIEYPEGSSIFAENDKKKEIAGWMSATRFGGAPQIIFSWWT
jgi:hypothetical protein